MLLVHREGDILLPTVQTLMLWLVVNMTLLRCKRQEPVGVDTLTYYVRRDDGRRLTLSFSHAVTEMCINEGPREMLCPPLI